MSIKSNTPMKQVSKVILEPGMKISLAQIGVPIGSEVPDGKKPALTKSGAWGEAAIETDVEATEIADAVAEVVAETGPVVEASGFGGVLAGLAVHAGLWLSAGGSGSGGGVAAIPDSVLSVGIYAGPVIKNNQLTIAAYAANGEVLQAAKSVVLVDGRVTVKFRGDYTGPVLLKVVDNGEGDDYLNEVDGEAVDLSIDLRAIVQINGGSTTVEVNISPLTELVVQEITKDTGGDGGSSITNMLLVSADSIRTANAKVVEAFGLGDDTEIALREVSTTIKAEGEPETESNIVGQILAAISGYETTFAPSPAGKTADALAAFKLAINADESAVSATSSLLSIGAQQVQVGSKQNTDLMALVDKAKPTLTITDDEAATGNIAGGDITYTFTFSEPVTGFAVGDINVVGGAAGTFTTVSPAVYRLVVTPTAGFEGSVTVDVAGAVATDIAGNTSSAASQSAQTVDMLAPTLAITSTASALKFGETATITSDVTALKVGETATITFTFSEDPATSFAWDGTAGDVIVSGGMLSAISGTGLTRVAIFTPTANMASGTARITVASDSYTDGAGNGGGNGTMPTINHAGITDATTLNFAAPFNFIDLSAVAEGTGGFVINGQNASDISGKTVAGGGDVNGDGLADLIVSAHFIDPYGRANAGGAFVVFGKTSTTTVDLSAVANGAGGFAINGPVAFEYAGASVDIGGDINGDGLADLIVGAHLADADSNDAGRTYVVFGKTSTTDIDLATVAAGNGGFVIKGQAGGDKSGVGVSSAGDVNGDGLADLIVGANSATVAGLAEAGRSYVVFGKTNTTAINLSAVAAGNGGFVINGQGAGDASGFSVASAGDINGDGLADLIVGAHLGDPAGGNDAGRTYVVFGKANTSAINLSAVALGDGGFVINGECAIDRSGGSVAAAGDVNGDGLADLLVGASLADPNDLAAAGRSYVIFGSTTGAFGQTAVDQLGTSDNDILTGTTAADVLVGGAGNDILTGGGGADVLYGGSGDDTLVVTADTVAALAAGFGAGGNTTQLSRIDGGGGIDTLALGGGGITLDLRAIANQGGSAPSSASRIESIERIDLTGSGNNTLIVGLSDVFDMAGLNSFNNANGWADGSYNLAAGGPNGVNPERRHQLVIDGDTGDAVSAAGWGASVGTVTNNSVTYNVYNQGLYAQLLIDTAVTQTSVL